MKLYKYLFTSVITALSGLFLTGCSDDTVLDTVVPDEFSVELTSTNITWNETEAVIDFAADASWSASTSYSWITIGTTSGSAGEERLFLTFDANTYLLSRTGTVELKCGDNSCIITVVQGGCTDSDEVASITTDIEVLSLDYQSTEVSFAVYEAYIEGNLGMTLEEFGAGLDDDGDIEMFIVADDGSWTSCGSTAGTRCSAWLDKNLDVTTWDGSGYPSIATCIETYSGDSPSFAIIRAPGLPENTKHNLTWGYTLASDHSKYLIIDATVTYPAVEYTGTVVATYDVSLTIPADHGDYEGGEIEIDIDAVLSALGATSSTNLTVGSWDDDGEWISYTGNSNEYWYNSSGSTCSWGADGCAFFIGYYGTDSDNLAEYPEDASLLYVGAYPSFDNCNTTVNFGFWYNQSIVLFNVNIIIGDGTDTGSSTETTVNYEIVKTINLSVPAVTSDYITVEFDHEAIADALGLSSIKEATLAYLYSSTSIVTKYTANGQGFWFDLTGAPCTWGTSSYCFYAEWYGYDEDNLAEYPEDLNLLYCGVNSEYLSDGETYLTHVDFINSSEQAVRVNLIVTVSL